MVKQQLEDQEKFLAEMEKIMQLVRASKGLPPEPKDAISNLINVKNELERTRFPTYTILSQVVYLKLGRLRYGEDAQILDEWADLLCHALIEYKGQGRKEWVEAVKRSEAPDQTSFTFGSPRTEPQQKKRWFQRTPREAKELKNQ